MAIVSAASRCHRRSLLIYLRLFSSSPPTPQKQPVSTSAAKNKLRTEHDLDKSIPFVSSSADSTSSSATSRHAVDFIVKRLARSRRFSDIEKLLESRKKDPMVVREPYVASIITSYGYAGMIDHAVRTFEEIDALGAPRTVLSFNSLLTAFNHTDNPGRVVELFPELSQKHSITPDKVSYGILIKSLCQLHTPEKAYPILKEMKDKGIEITSVTYTTLLDTLYKDEKMVEAEKLWKEMVSKGCTLDVAAYNVRVMYGAHHKKPEDVIKLIDEIVSAGLKPDTISYNYLITCYCKNGQYKDAKKVYKGLQEKGCVPNAATYRNFMYFLCKNGDFTVGLEVCMEGIRKNKIPDFGPMKMLLEGLVKNYKVKEAKWLIKQVRKRFPENFVTRWKKVEERLGLDFDVKDSLQAEAA